MPDNSCPLMEFLTADPGWKAGRILDVRPAESFLAGHLKGAVSHPLGNQCPSEEVPSILLPPRHEPLLVVGEADQRFPGLARELESRGRVSVTAVEISEQLIAALPGDMAAAGPDRGHLWAAPPWLEDYLEMLPPAAKGRVLDLGCGSGRAMVFLAERGYRVTGLDWQPEALELGRQLALARKVECDFRLADLRKPDLVPPGPWAVILNFRYLQRELLGHFHALLQPGGTALVRTFRDSSGYQGHPHPRHRLQRGELLKYFPRGQFEVLAHEQGFDPDGRPASGIVARKI